jgi:hypothetical protein
MAAYIGLTDLEKELRALLKSRHPAVTRSAVHALRTLGFAVEHEPHPYGEGAAQEQPVVPDDALGALATEIAAKASAGDSKYFESLMDEPYKGQSEKLIEQVKRSEIQANYKQRFRQLSPTAGRLDYHYLEKACHFQIDLAQENGNWKVTRIWFCR